MGVLGGLMSVAKEQPTWRATLGGQGVTVKANTKSETRARIKQWAAKAWGDKVVRLPVGVQLERVA